MGEVVDLDVVSCLDMPVEKILGWAGDAGLTSVVVIGFTASGEFYFAANQASGPENLWLLKLAEKKLVEIGDPDV